MPPEPDSEPSFDDRFLNNLPDYVTATPVDGDPFERAAQRVRAPYEKANQRESGLPDVLNVIGGRVKSGLTAPRDALTGDLQVNDPETNMPTQQAIGRSMDTATLAGGGSPFGSGVENGMSLGVVPVDVAKRLNVKKGVPSDVLKQAAENTPGASVDPEGALIVKVHRNQKPDQELEESVRNGVFYLPSTRNAKYYKNPTDDFKKNTYGGSQNIQGETAYLNPLVVKGATGGKAPEVAYEQLNGKGSFKNMHDDALRTVLWHDKAGRIGPSQEEMVSNFFEKHAPEMVGKEWQVLENSKHGNQLQYALKEAAVAHAAREAGHDGIIGYSVGRDKKPFLSEVFDVRETHYPGTQGEYELHPKFLSDTNKLSASGLPVTFTPVEGDPHKSANTVGDAIDTAAKKYGINPTVLKGIASIESSWDPGSNRNKATQYKGLFQIGKEEWKQHGNGDIYNAKDNANAAAKMLSEHAQWFKDNYGRDPTPGEFYMMHQQGREFISNGTMTNISGNPYPGMRGPQTPETFKQGWSDTLARKMAQFGDADSISDGTERPSSNVKVASNDANFKPSAHNSPHKFTPVDFNPFDLVNHANHVPYGAGASDTPSGYPVNIDKRIPQHNDELKLPDGEPADLHKYLTIHEIEEYKAMKNGTPYHTAHHDIATPMEKKAVESDGVDWKKYTHVMDGYLKKTEEEGYKDLPKGLYAKPYHSRSLIKPEPKTEKGKQNA